jgi:hypothetical protein
MATEEEQSRGEEERARAKANMRGGEAQPCFIELIHWYLEIHIKINEFLCSESLIFINAFTLKGTPLSRLSLALPPQFPPHLTSQTFDHELKTES